MISWLVRCSTMVVLVGLCGTAVAQTEEEAEKSARQARTLADRIPSVTGRVFSKAGRLEIAPGLGLSINDPFYQHLVGSLSILYHLDEEFSVGLSGDYYGAFESDIVVAGGVAPTTPDFNRPEFSSRIEFAWSPFYGKASLLAETITHFDAFISVGGGIVGSSETSTATMGTIAIGQRFLLNDWSALRWEIRDQIFSLARSPTVDSDAKLQNLITLSVGWSLFFLSRDGGSAG